MSFPTAFIVTIVNTKTKEVTGIWLDYPEQIDEISLDEDQVMYVNQFSGEDCTDYE